jgi:hypothetical protein
MAALPTERASREQRGRLPGAPTIKALSRVRDQPSCCSFRGTGLLCVASTPQEPMTDGVRSRGVQL